jgi:purine catabolism regulator
MQRAEPVERGIPPAGDRGVEKSTPRSTPLTIVSGAVAGDNLEDVAGSASRAIGQPVAIAIPALGEPIASPAGAVSPEALGELASLAAAMIRGDAGQRTAAIVDAVPVGIGDQIVGLVAAIDVTGTQARPDRRTWLDAAAAAAAVRALIRETREGTPEDSRQALLRALSSGPYADPAALAAQARRLGFDFSAGGVAFAARRPPGESAGEPAAWLADHPDALLDELGDGRIGGLLAGGSVEAADELVRSLADRGLTAGRSNHRRRLSDLHEALREAELMVELAAEAAGQEETYRLLVGVLVRDPDEVELLRTQTISPLVAYDERHDTELLATLGAFLAHHGSTSETAEAMGLHRHTVGYRLARVHEVSGLSPYESDGRERLSLGLKAHQILEAQRRLASA